VVPSISLPYRHKPASNRRESLAPRPVIIAAAAVVVVVVVVVDGVIAGS